MLKTSVTTGSHYCTDCKHIKSALIFWVPLCAISFQDVTDNGSPQLPLLLSLLAMFVCCPSQSCSAICLHMIIRQGTYCFPLPLLPSMWVLHFSSLLSSCILDISISISMYKCIFCFHFYLKLPHYSHAPCMVFSASSCRPTSHLSQVFYLTVGKLSRNEEYYDV